MTRKLIGVGAAGLAVSLIFGVILFFIARANNPSAVNQPSIAKNKALPNIFLPDLTGEMHTFSELAGKPAVINFWATWCDPCVEEMPLLQSYAEEFPQVHFIGINSGEDKELVEPFLSEYGIKFPIWLDLDERMVDKLSIIGFPTTYFIDSTGKIITIHIGQLSPELLDRNLSQLRVEP